MKYPVSMTVNGAKRKHPVDPRLLLVHYLRETLGLTGTHVGCDTSQCGACTVLIDGQAVKSCTVLAVQADGRERHDDRGPRDERQAASAAGRVLGEARPAVRLLHARHDHDRLRSARAKNPKPTDAEIRHGLDGNLCRCTGYQNIVTAVRRTRPRMAKA